jgi:hypothetical protein
VDECLEGGNLGSLVPRLVVCVGLSIAEALALLINVVGDWGRAEPRKRIIFGWSTGVAVVDWE